MSVAHIYEGWPRVQTRLMYALPKLTPQELQLASREGAWPVWAILSHVAGSRVYWLCNVFKEPGAESTPFGDLTDEGWEDHLDQPRGRDELMDALASSWQIVESCLERWTPEMLDEVFTRRMGDGTQRHSRHSMLTRLAMHDSFHCGEIALLFGMNRSGVSMDPWEPVT